MADFFVSSYFKKHLVIGIGSMVLFLWLVKFDRTQPLIHGAILAGLLGFRVWDKSRRAPAAIGSARWVPAWPVPAVCTS